MGLDYSYLLYFHRQDLWTVVKGLTDYACPTTKFTRIIFPDKVVELSLEASLNEDHVYQHNAEEISLVLSMRFPVDEAVFDWLKRLGNHSIDDPNSSTDLQYGYVGCIYLFIHQGMPEGDSSSPAQDTVLFDFQTTGTRMSMLFFESEEIRNTFTDILDNYNGICGVFNRENDGEVFWYKGRHLNVHVDDPFISIDAITALLG